MRSRTVDLTVMHALHDAFRRDLETLTRAAASLGQDPDAQERLRVGWTLLADQLHHHHTVEDEQLWPLVRRSWRRSPDALQALDAMEDEHILVDPALAAVGEDVRRGIPPAESLERLNSVVRDHLAHEESEALPLIVRAVTPQDWDAFSAKQARRLGLTGAAQFFPWLLLGQDDIRTERVLGILPAPLRWAYRHRWQPQWTTDNRILMTNRPGVQGWGR